MGLLVGETHARLRFEQRSCRLQRLVGFPDLPEVARNDGNGDGAGCRKFVDSTTLGAGFENSKKLDDTRAWARRGRFHAVTILSTTAPAGMLPMLVAFPRVPSVRRK
jgi:hypothetical protein